MDVIPTIAIAPVDFLIVLKHHFKDRDWIENRMDYKTRFNYTLSTRKCF